MLLWIELVYLINPEGSVSISICGFSIFKWVAGTIGSVTQEALLKWLQLNSPHIGVVYCQQLQLTVVPVSPRATKFLNQSLSTFHSYGTLVISVFTKRCVDILNKSNHSQVFMGHYCCMLSVRLQQQQQRTLNPNLTYVNI